MARIKLKNVEHIINVAQTYDQIIGTLNERQDLVSISCDEVVMKGIPTTRICIVISEIVFIRE
jgi:hypothetical protein